MTEIQKLPAFPENIRPETGPMQFGDDWPGVFIRGDNALADAMMLEQALKSTWLPADAWPLRAVLTGLLRTLQSCRVP